MIEAISSIVDAFDLLDIFDRDLETTARFISGFIFPPKGGFGYIPVQ